MKPVVISENEWVFLLKCAGCGEELLYLPHTVTAENFTEEFLRARDSWTSRGEAELNFNGGLSFSRSFARILYDLKNQKAVFRWEHGGAGECWLKSTADYLRIVWVPGQVTVTWVRPGDLLRLCREEIAAHPGGVLMGKQGDRSIRRSPDAPEDTWLSDLAACAAVLYWRSENA